MGKLCIIDRQLIAGIPVCDVHKENDPTNKIRTLHRNMLLPFMGLPSEIQNENPDTRTQNDDIPVSEVAESLTFDDSTSSDSDESDSSLSEKAGRGVPQRRPPQHRPSDQRGKRVKKEPDHLQVGQMVNWVYEFCVQESMVTKL